MKKARRTGGTGSCRAIADMIAQRTKNVHSGGRVFGQQSEGRFGGLTKKAAETRCDMDYTEPNSAGHQAYQDLLKQRLLNPLREPAFDPVWGSGEPVIDYSPAFSNLGPCMQEILTAHEETHQKAAKTPCMNLKNCVDAADSSWFGGFFGKSVTLNDYIKCLNSNTMGLPANCDADEQAAYAETVKKANQIKHEPRCQAETGEINRNLPFWTKAAKSYKC